MALLETDQRSATVAADSDVSSYEWTTAAFETLCRRHPEIARKMFAYFAREMSYRLVFCIAICVPRAIDSINACLFGEV
jgi:CRP-like cAMP-binding protein